VDVIALFRDGDLSATLENQLSKAQRAVNEVPETELRVAEANTIATRLFERFKVDPVTLTEGAVSVQAEEADIDRRMVPGLDWGFPGDPPTVRGTRVIFNVPFTGDAALLRLKPSTWTTVLPRAVITGSELRFVYDVQSSQVAATKASFDRDLAFAKQYIEWGADEVAEFNAKLVSLITNTLNQRLARLEETSEGLAALGLPVRQTKTVGIDAIVVRSSAPTGARTQSAGGPPYDVALSFAGEDRAYVQQVATYIAEAGAKVFYDEFQTVALWGKDLVEHLQDIYQNQARFCVLFISKHYVKKPWPTHERRSAMARALVAKAEYLLPARFDDSTLPGLQPTIGYVDLRKLSPKDFADLVRTKIGIPKAEA
jgi:hypothetical protein